MQAGLALYCWQRLITLVPAGNGLNKPIRGKNQIIHPTQKIDLKHKGEHKIMPTERAISLQSMLHKYLIVKFFNLSNYPICK